jgi:hypothetical protein
MQTPVRLFGRCRKYIAGPRRILRR